MSNGKGKPVIPNVLGLSRRVGQTLSGVLRGLSEKEVAAELKLSRHTVHVYVKHLYTRFGVNSRSALLSLWIVRGSEYGPMSFPPSSAAPSNADVAAMRDRLLAEVAELDRKIATRVSKLHSLQRQIAACRH